MKYTVVFLLGLVLGMMLFSTPEVGAEIRAIEVEKTKIVYEQSWDPIPVERTKVVTLVQCSVPATKRVRTLQVPEVVEVLEAIQVPIEVIVSPPAEVPGTVIPVVEVPEEVTETCDNSNPGNAKCVGKAGEEPNGKPGWNHPPGVRGKSDK